MVTKGYRLHVVEILHRLANLQPNAGMTLDTEFVMSGVEVGVHRGWTSHAVLQMFPRIVWHMVDPWKAYADDGALRDVGVDDRRSTRRWDKIHEEAVRRVKKFGQRAVIHRATSGEAVRTFPDGALDIVFIDGEHSSSAVVDDSRCWLPKLRVGGIMGWHDYRNPKYPGVTEAVDSLGFAVERGLAFTCWMTRE